MEELLNIRTSYPGSASRSSYREPLKGLDGASTFAESWSAHRAGSPGTHLDAEDERQHDSRPQSSNLPCVDSKEDPELSDLDGQDLSEKGQGSLVVNGQGDHQYLGACGSFCQDNLLMLRYVGPSSGFSLLSQASKYLSDGNAIHQHLHMSEFNHAGNGVQGGNTALPPKHIANEYINGMFSNETSVLPDLNC